MWKHAGSWRRRPAAETLVPMIPTPEIAASPPVEAGPAAAIGTTPADPTPTALDHEKLRLLLSLLNDKSQPNINALTGIARNLDILALNVKAFGYDLARRMAEALPPPPPAGPARHVGLPCKLSTQADMESDWVAHWCRELQQPPIYHRKVWELAYLLQAAHDAGMLRAGVRGLGFGCGTEPIASYFAAQGMALLITDLPPTDARAQDWSTTNQLAASLDHGHHPHLVNREIFEASVSHRFVDMNIIPDDLVDFDLCWSVCALEHVGSIEKGLRFIENSLRCLRPGGVAIHTTEFNINPDGPTIDNWPTVLFQQKHIESLAERLRAQGHGVAPLDFDPGDKPLDHFIDLPPFHDGTMAKVSAWLGQPSHLKVAIDGFACTCIGLIITKAG